ncbi:MAG TPA: cereblon family protein [Syntrophobacteria bacterium]|nr:cereblon family protein [Syntrophobacteria bacterium]
MAFTHSVPDGIGGNGAKAYQCVACGGLVTYSDRLICIGTSTRHRFVNPAGVKCEFHTFFSCPGAVAHPEATEAHTWFPGYRWRLAFCRRCGDHLGWHYEATSPLLRPQDFWGILVAHLSST